MIGRTMWYPRHVKKDWRDRLQVGDVVAYPSGLLRVVREVTYQSNGYLLAVAFSIKACSWTKRSYTIVDRAQLNTVKAKPMGVRVNLRSRLDRMLLEDIQDKTRHFYCHQVKNLP